MFTATIPSTLLAVEGSERTLTWVEVIPSTGVCVAVGCAAGGVIVPVGTTVCVLGSVDVMIKGVRVNCTSSLRLVTQLVLKRTKTARIILTKRMGTAGLYRLSH